VLATGPFAVNTAIKAVAIARANLAPNGVDLVVVPTLTDRSNMAYTFELFKSNQSLPQGDLQELKV
jgi:hypothetical protein